MKDDFWYLAEVGEKKNQLLDGYLLENDSLQGATIGPLRQINIFVGENNSGKSRLIRRIMNHAKYRFGFKSQNQSPKLLQDLASAVNKPILRNKQEIYLTFSVQDEIPEELGVDEWTSTSIQNIGIISGDQIQIALETLHISLKKDFLNVRKILELEPKERLMYHSENKISEYLLQIKIVLALCCGPNSDQFWSSARTRHSRNRQTTAPRRIEKASLEEENLNKICELLEAIKGFTQRSVETNSKVYVPILRSTHRLWNHDESNPNQGLFGFTVRKNYKTELTETVEIHTGQELFHKILEARNGESTKREEFEAFEKFISDQFFPGKKVDIVAKIVNLSDPEKLREAIMQQSISVSINGEERDIHKLGDGVQALIMLTFPIFMAEPGSFIFIEEPELNLHPGMQRIFLEVLKKFSEDEEKNLTFFMTTHSNHFLDLTITEDAPVSIFTLRKNEESKKFEIRNVHSGHNEPLELLGVQNSSVYIANCSLWVEGPTDRRYIRKYLDLYIDEKKKTPFKEDLHYVFFLYGGILLNNYSLEEAIPSSDEKIRANRLNNRFMLVADKDDSPAKQEIHKLRDKLRKNGFEYVTTSPAREIENLLSKEILIEVLPKVFSGWLGKKGEAIALLDAKEIQKTALLTLLRREIGTAGLKASYSKETINGFNGADKKAICEEALKVMTWKKMSPEAKKFTEKIYNFIASQNAMGASNS